MLTRWWRNAWVFLDRPRAIRTLQRMERQLPDPRLRWAIPYLFKGKGHFRYIRPIQTPAEVVSLFTVVADLRPRRILEIGTATGGTLYLWAQAAADDATLVSVDLPGGAFGGGYPACRSPFYRRFARPGQTLHLVRGDSHAPQTCQTVQRLFGSAAVDFLFIDADHTYEGARADFLQYAPLVRPGGLIGFHDILPNPGDTRIQVSRLWQQLRPHLDCTEFVHADERGRRLGIGILRVGAQGLNPALVAPLA